MLTQVRKSLLRIRRFIDHQIWEQDLSSLPTIRAFLLREVRVALIVGEGITRGNLALRASAMTFTTLVTLVPALIIGFSVFRAFGGLPDFETRLEHLLYENVMPGQRDEVRQWLAGFIGTVRSGAFKGAGLVLLAGGTFNLLNSIEGAFNDIWGVRRGRSLFHRLSTYVTIIVLTPLLLGVSLSMTASLESSEFVARWFGDPAVARVGFRMLSVLSTGIAFTMLYLVMPNTKVRLRAAFPAGLTAAILWEFSKLGYAAYLKSATMVTTVYGSLAAIPLFLIWIHLTWVVVLFGAQLTFAQDAADDFREEERAAQVSPRERLRVALHLCLEACRAHRQGSPAPELVAMSHRLRLPLRLLRQVADALTERGILHTVRTTGDGGLAPARAPEAITVYSIVSCVLEQGHVPGAGRKRIAPRAADELVEQIDDDIRQRWEGITIDSCLELEPEAILTIDRTGMAR